MSEYVGIKAGELHERTELSEYYCARCGYPVTDHDSYCRECGGAFQRSFATEPCDRDALLTVAHEMDYDASMYRGAAESFTECGNHDAAEICYEAAGEYNDYAKIIREALGVER